MTDTRLVFDLDEQTYHADRSTLSSTGAKTLLRSPRKFWWQQSYGQESSDAKEFGSLVHALVLGQPHDFIVKRDPVEVDCPQCHAIPGAPCEGVKTYHRARKPEQSGTPIAAPDWGKAHEIRDAIAGHPIARELFTGGQAEVSAYGVEPSSGVAMRGRFDYLRDDGWLIDLKTTATDASPAGFKRTIANYGYDLQAAWYWALAEQNGIDVKGFRFVVVEKTAPFLIGVYELDKAAIEHGWALAQLACDTYRQCLAFDEWPQWHGQDHVITLSLPKWRYDNYELEDYLDD